MSTEFYDSAGARFPAGARYVCLYADGDYAVRPADSVRWLHVRWITVLGGADAAKYAGCLDWERGNEAFTGGELRAWAAGRKAMNKIARVYVDFANLEQAHKDVDGRRQISRAGDDFVQLGDRGGKPVHFPVACDQRTAHHY